MTIPFWCVFFSALLIYVAKLPAAAAMGRDKGGYDNHHPRAQQSQLTGMGARAVAAHQNSFEVFPLFVAGVLIAHVTQTQGWLIDTLAIVFLVSRIAYLALYLANLAWQRTVVWLVGIFCCLLLMLSPLLR
ncbi:MAPEG family protein [Pseudomonas matsuisoli]|uniref:Membrane protein n=1 Tax=Pseudomonas matsuisoli TaxID=1515666 RepID=A0A917Q0W5_9PSED|nr:MAPEG family protein [Pseudomonas matsuisoli]GGK05843.1 membrane protein [Pseudomonas matsuisoli]